MKLEMVATKFQVLIRTIVTTLDVYSFNSMDICGKVKELKKL
ncbi:hypothetical protein Gotri_015582, partial [Gossypium trilobum]|nr:hypothetical protein [Gossypium trilobum]